MCSGISRILLEGNALCTSKYSGGNVRDVMALGWNNAFLVHKVQEADPSRI